MNTFKEDVSAALHKFQSMQECHCKAFECEENPDLERFVFERSQAFAELKEHLSLAARKTMLAGQEQAELNRICRDGLASILNTEELLTTRANNFRNRLSHRMQELGKFKKGLHGYANASMLRSSR